MGFHIGPDFHVSSDQHICVLRVALRAAEGFFILVLIFMYPQIKKQEKQLGCYNNAWIKFLSRIAKRQGSLLPMKVILVNF